MLQEGHRLMSEGVDVVIGLLETHGRQDIVDLSQGFETLPRIRQEYRGHVLEEMDVEAIIARRPEVALIDELAHTNVPGTRNAKRYQDVQQILAAGIHVITTLNVQHLESLYDTVEKTVHVKVRERLPDSVVAEADEIVNVDLTTNDLKERLREGKIYPSERVETALSHFFQTSNLEHLRELTLRELASQIDLRMREGSQDDADPTPDQVMVCLSSRGPNSEMMLRYASRLAGRLNRNWYAVYVQTPSEEPTVIDAYTQRILSSSLTLAKQLGAMVFTYKGEDIPDTILRFAREYRVGHIVIGHPGEPPFWKKLLGKKSLVEELIEKAKGITVVVLDTRDAEPLSFSLENNRNISSAERRGAKSHLSDLISSRRVVIWNVPIEKDTLLRTLAEVAAKDFETCDAEDILEAVLEREKLGSTFFANESVAMPHARIKGLSTPIISLGLTRRGVREEDANYPIRFVFLILTPADVPGSQVDVLALISRANKDGHFDDRLAESKNPEELIAILHELRV
jgi:two-component system sensor histidine kinase KdpD